MAAPDITASTRYFVTGVTRVVWTPTVAVKAAPTRAEINAGTDLSTQVSEAAGWQVAGEDLETRDMGSVFVSKIPANTTADDSSLTMYASVNSVDVRSLLSRGTNGFILWFGEGDVAGRKFDNFPVRVRSTPKPRDLDQAGRITVEFSVTSEPVENITVPA